jgi:hypothetical protein
MGWGLGKNSPIVLSLGRGNYEAMLDRHGQWVRWRVSKKCTCVSGVANQSDPRCKKCGGSGEIYSYQKEYTDTMRVRVDGGVATLPIEYIECEILRAYDANGVEFTPLQMGNYVKFSSPQRILKNAEVIEIEYRQPLTAIIDRVELEYIGNGYYRVPGVLSGISKIEGVTYHAPGDIVDMDAVFDSKAQEVDILEFRQNTVRLKDEGFTQPITAFGVEWLKPYKFFVLSQNISSEEDEKLLEMHQGDAISTFPYHFDVSEGDIITVLSGTNTKKVVLKHKGPGIDDTLMDFFVQNVTYLASDTKEYKVGIDFIIIGSNKLHVLYERWWRRISASTTFFLWETDVRAEARGRTTRATVCQSRLGKDATPPPYESEQ